MVMAAHLGVGQAVLDLLEVVVLTCPSTVDQFVDDGLTAADDVRIVTFGTS